MIEIAKGIASHDAASKVFEIRFISDGGDFERLIEAEGFPIQRLEPRLTKEKIEHIARVDRGEQFAPAFSDEELIERVSNETAYLRQVVPAAVVTGSYLTIPVTCRVLSVPLIWVIQSTWLEPFFTTGVGMTDHIRPKLLKSLADLLILGFINFWIRYGFLSGVNKTAKHFGVEGYKSIFDFWRRGCHSRRGASRVFRDETPPGSLLRRPADRETEFSTSATDNEYSARQAADLFRHGKLWNTGDRSQDSRKLRRAALSCHRSYQISASAAWSREDTFQRDRDGLAARAPSEQNG